MTISNQLLPIMKLKLNLCLLREQRCYYTLPQYIFVNLFNYVKKIIEAGSKLCVQGNRPRPSASWWGCTQCMKPWHTKVLPKQKKKQLFPISKKSFQPSYANWVLRVYFPQMYHRKNLINWKRKVLKPFLLAQTYNLKLQISTYVFWLPPPQS